MAKPTAVKIAEALGWTNVQYDDLGTAWGRNPQGTGGLDSHGLSQVPQFDNGGWGELGPLIETYGISLNLTTGQIGGGWTASTPNNAIVKTAAKANAAVVKTLLAILSVV